mmetsp:Transcript_75930/g.209981  ORF Transcript_75930/g.209981 Transcript_75930/m.209981 type:complete len:252 (+) Transcript_75930:741-1496(+)
MCGEAWWRMPSRGRHGPDGTHKRRRARLPGRGASAPAMLAKRGRDHRRERACARLRRGRNRAHQSLPVADELQPTHVAQARVLQELHDPRMAQGRGPWRSRRSCCMAPRAPLRAPAASSPRSPTARCGTLRPSSGPPGTARLAGRAPPRKHSGRTASSPQPRPDRRSRPPPPPTSELGRGPRDCKRRRSNPPGQRGAQRIRGPRPAPPSSSGKPRRPGASAWDPEAGRPPRPRRAAPPAPGCASSRCGRRV